MIVAPSLWDQFCYFCRQSAEAHPASGLCPDGSGDVFSPAAAGECLSPTTHEVGCDCLLGLCD